MNNCKFSMLQFLYVRLMQTLSSLNVLGKFTELSKKPPCCWSSVLHQHGGRKWRKHLKLTLAI